MLEVVLFFVVRTISEHIGGIAFMNSSRVFSFACTRNARGICERDTSQSVVVPKLGTKKILVAR